MPTPVTPDEGWGVLHLLLSVDHATAAGLPAQAGKSLAATLSHWAGEVQLHQFAVLGHKADIMLVALEADLSRLRRLQTDVLTTEAAPAVSLSWSYVSLTETSEYLPSREEEVDRLRAAGVEDADLERRLGKFDERMARHREDRLHPELPRWEVACFYPMSHRRRGDDNWYLLPYEERRELMHDHGRSGRAFTGRVLQLVSGSTGLDDWEWAVTLLAHDVADLKEVVYTLRFDEASARFAEFGPFVMGLRREDAGELVAEVGLGQR